MGLSIERNGFTHVENLGFQIVTDLVAAGFAVVAVDQLETDQFQPGTNHYILEPGLDVDPLSEEQPWRLVLEFNETTGYINVWALTPTQIDDQNKVTVYAEEKESGRLSIDNSSSNDSEGYNFWNRNSDDSKWSCYQHEDVDEKNIPLSYQLSVTDHGVFFAMWAESYSDAGDCFCWFLIQRPVNCETGQIVTHGKSPVVCVFSQYGNSKTSYNLDTNNKLSKSILQFIVREEDINKPTVPASAIIPTEDREPLLNPIQQTAITEDGNYVIKLPHGFCTSRHVYDYKLDMIAYTSADVLGQWSKPKFTLFGEETPRTYKSLNANYPKNTGMRLLCLIEGNGM